MCAELRLLIHVIINVKDVNLVGSSISLMVLDVKLDWLLRSHFLHYAIANEANNEEAEQSDYGNQEDLSASSEITRIFLFNVNFLLDGHIAWSLVSRSNFSIHILLRRNTLRIIRTVIGSIGL